jgi:hypothetical protein
MNNLYHAIQTSAECNRGRGRYRNRNRERSWSALRFRTCSLECEALSADDNSKQKALLDRRVAMLTKLGQRSYAVSEELGG